MVIHFSALIFDEFILMKVPEIFVPFLFDRDVISGSGYNLDTSVSFGVFAMYISILLLVTSHLRNKVIPAKIWRTIHYSSFLFYLLFLIHAYIGGTDSNEPWLLTIYISSVVLVFSLILIRIFGKRYFLPHPRPKPVALKDTANQSITQIV
jgi:predicted ferric reductase